MNHIKSLSFIILGLFLILLSIDLNTKLLKQESADLLRTEVVSLSDVKIKK